MTRAVLFCRVALFAIVALAAVNPVVVNPAPLTSETRQATPARTVTVTLVRWPSMCSLSDPVDLLIRDVAAELGERVTVAVEEYGQSELARRAGIKRFPAVFVGDVLMARPEDFGFEDSDDARRGRYVPWREPSNQRRFREDLKTLVLKALDTQAARG